MRITLNGLSLHKSEWAPKGDLLVDGSPVASITFSGLENAIMDPKVALDISWLHQGTGVERLDLELNGEAAPAGSRMSRNQMETDEGIREDRLDPGFTVADLVAAAPGTSFEGLMAILGDPTGRNRLVAEGSGYAKDAAVILADRERISSRQGRWDAIVSQITSVSVVVGSGRSMIAVGSQVLLFA